VISELEAHPGGRKIASESALHSATFFYLFLKPWSHWRVCGI